MREGGGGGGVAERSRGRTNIHLGWREGGRGVMTF